MKPLINCYLILSIFLNSNCYYCTQLQLTEVIKTDKGFVQGEILKTVRNKISYSSFRGIRYAKSPTGNRRFKPPEETESWSAIFQATSDGSSCPQINHQQKSYSGDEDCLNLNVYTPKIHFSNSNTNLLPVIFYIHGGKYLFGSNKKSKQGPDYVIEEQVVVVTINYRLGALGLLSLNLPDATGNAALKDQLLALKWVQKNIKAFGGDPSKVTISGQSVGAGCVDLHVLSDVSQGLFHGSISMSGTALSFWIFESQISAQNTALELARLLGYKTDDKKKILSMLYNESAENIVKATEKIEKENMRPFKPVREDKNIAGDSAFITDCILDKYKSGNFTRQPHIAGYLISEPLTFFSTGLTYLEEARKQINRENKLVLSGMADTAINIVKLNGGELPINIFNDAINSISHKLLHNIHEIMYVRPTDIKQQFMNNFSPVYYYRISIAPNASMHKLMGHIDFNGTAHGDDLAYIWHISTLDLPTDPLDPLVITRNRVVRLFTNFAKYSNPTPQGKNDTLLNILWPESGSKKLYLDINNNLSIAKRHIDANSKRLEHDYLKEIAKLLDCV